MARKATSKLGSGTSQSSATIGFEAKLLLAADKLRNNMDAGEYKRVVLGLILLKYISDTFDEHHARLVKNSFFGASFLSAVEFRAYVCLPRSGSNNAKLEQIDSRSAKIMTVPFPALQTRFVEIVISWGKNGTFALEQSRSLALCC